MDYYLIVLVVIRTVRVTRTLLEGIRTVRVLLIILVAIENEIRINKSTLFILLSLSEVNPVQLIKGHVRHNMALFFIIIHSLSSEYVIDSFIKKNY